MILTVVFFATPGVPGGRLFTGLVPLGLKIARIIAATRPPKEIRINNFIEFLMLLKLILRTASLDILPEFV